MPSLRDEQRALQATVLAANGVVSRAWDGEPERLAIYRNAYRARLADALRTNYPVLAELLGEEFDSLAHRYADARPSRHYSIRWHGDALWRSLEGALADLARMEWALGSAFDAADQDALGGEELQRIPVDDWSTMQLALHPSVQVLSMSWNVEAQWERVRAGDAAGTCEPLEHSLLVWRKSLQSHWRIASIDEGLALKALESEGTLDAACDAVSDEAVDSVGTWFAVWVQEGMLSAKCD